MYKSSLNGRDVIRLADKACIPRDEGNVDYREFLAWHAEGNEPLAADPPPPPSKDEVDATTAKADAKLTALKSLAPAEIRAWVNANFPSLTAAERDRLATLAVAVSILARRI